MGANTLPNTSKNKTICPVNFPSLQTIRSTKHSGNTDLEDDRSTKAECRELNVGLCFAGRVESLSDSDSRGGTDARQTYSSENVPLAVI